jgi:hypothetical protein
VPVEDFFTDTVLPDVAECLHLWFKIKTSDGRLRALEALRVIAEKELVREDK